MADPLSTFAANLKRERTARGMTQEGLAQEADLHMTDVARIERAERDPRLTTVTKLARGLGVPVADLMREVE